MIMMTLARSFSLEISKDRLVVAGMGEWAVASGPGSTLATYALGSCVAICAWDGASKVGGILHFMLPEASLNPDRARQSPGTFCDSGLPQLMQDLEALGAQRRRLRVFLAGGAKVLDAGNFFDIGRRNQLAARRRLWELGLAVDDEDTGGELSRTLKLSPDSGRVTVRDSFGERELGRSQLRRP
jgi:chemotaxis protein CheD